MRDDSANIDRTVTQICLPNAAESRPALPRLIADRYRLSREISRGGMGVVWLAHDTLLERVVALKFMKAELAASHEAALRFAREAKAAARLGTTTEFVVKVLDYGVDQGTSYIVMELLEGETLAARLERRGRVSQEELALIVHQIACALKKAHRLGFVHRDLKPENIFLSSHDEEERVKILDFGIVKDLGPGTITRSGQILGTFFYMSPEQVQGRAVDHRADLWSLGVMIYRALTGRLPFEEEVVGKLVFSICSDPIPQPSQVVPDLGSTVDEFMSRALARRPEERFQSAEELARAFIEVARISLPPPSSVGGPVSTILRSRVISALAPTGSAEK
jgi:eukaryotic-like serine/threonine-protein kinase